MLLLNWTPNNTHRPLMWADSWFFPSEQARILSFLFHLCSRAWGERRGLHAPRDSPSQRAGPDAWRDTASGPQAEGRPQPAWRGAAWPEVSAAAQVGETTEERSWRETTSEPKPGAWSDRSPERRRPGTARSEKTSPVITQTEQCRDDSVQFDRTRPWPNETIKSEIKWIYSTNHEGKDYVKI